MKRRGVDAALEALGLALAGEVLRAARAPCVSSWVALSWGARGEAGTFHSISVPPTGHGQSSSEELVKNHAGFLPYTLMKCHEERPLHAC